jgi:hypothetical protein
MTKLIIIVKFDCPFNFVYFSVFEYLCMLSKFLFHFWSSFYAPLSEICNADHECLIYTLELNRSACVGFGCLSIKCCNLYIVIRGID